MIGETGFSISLHADINPPNRIFLLSVMWYLYPGKPEDVYKRQEYPYPGRPVAAADVHSAGVKEHYDVVYGWPGDDEKEDKPVLLYDRAQSGSWTVKHPDAGTFEQKDCRYPLTDQAVPGMAFIWTCQVLIHAAGISCTLPRVISFRLTVLPLSFRCV